jgi:hypothetical protein
VENTLSLRTQSEFMRLEMSLNEIFGCAGWVLSVAAAAIQKVGRTMESHVPICKLSA